MRRSRWSPPPRGGARPCFAASWIEAGAADRAGAWLSLDRTDDEPQVFWRAVAAALIPVVRRPAEELRRIAAGGVTRTTSRGWSWPGSAVAPQPVALVLDDLHEIHSPQIHGGLLRLVQRPPPKLALLVTTRRDPPWPLAHLRLAGMVAEVRAADLAFRADEAAELCSPS